MVLREIAEQLRGLDKDAAGRIGQGGAAAYLECHGADGGLVEHEHVLRVAGGVGRERHRADDHAIVEHLHRCGPGQFLRAGEDGVDAESIGDSVGGRAGDAVREQGSGRDVARAGGLEGLVVGDDGLGVGLEAVRGGKGVLAGEEPLGVEADRADGLLAALGIGAAELRCEMIQHARGELAILFGQAVATGVRAFDVVAGVEVLGRA